MFERAYIGYFRGKLMNELQVFNSEEFGRVRTLDIDEKHILPQATSLMRLGIPILGKQLLTIVGV